MKILHVISQLTKGGAERVAVELANSFSRAGDSVTILVTHPADPELLEAEIDPSVDLRFASRIPKGKIATYAVALRWLAANREFVATRDIVHVHLTFGSTFGSLVALLRRLRGARTPKVIETYHAVGMAMPSLKRRLHMLLARSHDALVSMAVDPAIEKFRRSNPGFPYALIPNGISFSQERPSEAERLEYRRALGIPDDVMVVGTISRLVLDRSPERIVETFAQIARARGDVHFFIGGEGSESDRVRALARQLGLAERLNLPGLVLKPELPFSILDLYVTLNVGPTTGVAAIEAAAAGLPIVALQLDSTYAPAGGEWIFSSTDPASVAREALRLLGDHSERRRLAARQRDYAERNHGVETMAGAYREFYRSLLRETR